MCLNWILCTSCLCSVIHGLTLSTSIPVLIYSQSVSDKTKVIQLDNQTVVVVLFTCYYYNDCFRYLMTDSSMTMSVTTGASTGKVFRRTDSSQGASPGGKVIRRTDSSLSKQAALSHKTAGHPSISLSFSSIFGFVV